MEAKTNAGLRSVAESFEPSVDEYDYNKTILFSLVTPPFFTVKLGSK